jgi:hypothetical protein
MDVRWKEVRSSVEHTAMPRTLPTLLPADLELRLLRKSVGPRSTAGATRRRRRPDAADR